MSSLWPAPSEWRLLAFRGLWIAIRLILVVWMAEAGRTFLYQGF